MNTVIVNGDGLTPNQVADIAHKRAKAVASDDLAARMGPARELVDRAVEAGSVIYGVTTGFGALATTNIGEHELEELQLNLIRSHATGIGDPLPDELVRAILLLRARTLSQGHSGVRPVVVERLLDMLDRDILPVVPSKGSVGASGDLAPFAHLALPLIGEGLVKVDGAIMSPEDAGLEPLSLVAKEGISLLNGTEGMTSLGVIALERARRLIEAADIAAALSVEALLGHSSPFRPEIHALRPHPGQMASAARIAALLEGSAIVESHSEDLDHAVQDPYSLRCAPQVHGAVADTIDHLETILTRELGAVVDNPIVFPETGEVLSGGNFHGEPLAFALDFAAIAVAELGAISERRTDRLLDPVRSQGLPAFLAARPGIESGYMIGQYLQAALVAENKILAHPASVDSIPTSGSQEDHVSMGWGAGIKLLTVLENVRTVLAVEILCGVQGLEYRAPLSPAPGTARVLELVRAHVPSLDSDRAPSAEIETVAGLIGDGALHGSG